MVPEFKKEINTLLVETVKPINDHYWAKLLGDKSLDDKFFVHRIGSVISKISKQTPIPSLNKIYEKYKLRKHTKF